VRCGKPLVVRTFVEAMDRKNLLAEEEPVPTAEELGAEFERFLAERERGD